MSRDADLIFVHQEALPPKNIMAKWNMGVSEIFVSFHLVGNLPLKHDSG